MVGGNSYIAKYITHIYYIMKIRNMLLCCARKVKIKGIYHRRNIWSMVDVTDVLYF